MRKYKVLLKCIQGWLSRYCHALYKIPFKPRSATYNTSFDLCEYKVRLQIFVLLASMPDVPLLFDIQYI
jgi:hypothetical protein